MIRSILWKEWHEHRSKYLAYWVIINAPIMLLALAIGLSTGARAPFADLSDAMTIKYLPMALVESILVPTLFLIVTGYLAVATFSPEIKNRSLFFLYEQPLSRKRYVAIKLLNGACHVILATCCAILLLPVAGYVMMLLSGRVSTAGSSSTFVLVMGAAARSTVWCSLISLAAFTASALISALASRWWLAAACSIILTVLLIYTGSDFFGFFPDMPDNSMSIGMSLSTGGGQWVTISRAASPAELMAFGHWRLWPLLSAAIATAAFSAAIALLYDRKELR